MRGVAGTCCGHDYSPCAGKLFFIARARKHTHLIHASMHARAHPSLNFFATFGESTSNRHSISPPQHNEHNWCVSIGLLKVLSRTRHWARCMEADVGLSRALPPSSVALGVFSDRCICTCNIGISWPDELNRSSGLRIIYNNNKGSVLMHMCKLSHNNSNAGRCS